MTLVDTHAHLDQPDFADDRAAVIDRARAAGVGQMVQVAVTPDTWASSLEIARAYPFIRAAFGVHPNDATALTTARLAELRQLIIAHRDLVVGIGETGLDYYRDWTTPEQQHPAFAAQLGLGREFDLPMIVHCRNADADTIKMIATEGRGTRGVMHCFSGNLRTMQQALDLGYYISLAGPVTFKNAHDRHEVAVNVPLDHLLVETDCPFLTPEPYRGRRNEPAYVAYTAAKIADLRGITPNQLAAATTANARRLFGLAESELALPTIIQPTAIFFDLDGTLCDHLTSVARATEYAVPFIQQRYPLFDGSRFDRDRNRVYDEAYRAGGVAALQIGRDEFWRRALSYQNITDMDFIVELAERYGRVRLQNLFLYPESKGVLERLQGQYTLGLITNGPRELQWAEIKAVGIAGYFPPETIIVAGEVGLMKPDVRIFELARERANLVGPPCQPSDMLFIGDNKNHDVEGAQAAGWHGIWINRYPQHADPPVPPAESEIHTLDALFDYLKS